jgi:hypothetical protein
MAFNEKSLLLNGFNQRVDFSNPGLFSFDYNNEFSISAWIRMDASVTGSKCIFSKLDAFGTGYSFRLVDIAGTSILFADLYDGGTKWLQAWGSTDLKDSLWHHVTMTYDASNLAAGIQFYADGIEETYTYGTNGPLTNMISAETPHIGFINVVLGQYFQGRIDEVSIWDKKLLLAEVVEIYNDHAASDLTTHSAWANVITWIRGDGDTAPTLLDHKGSNDGTLVNMTDEDIIWDVPVGNTDTVLHFPPTYTTIPLVGCVIEKNTIQLRRMYYDYYDELGFPLHFWALEEADSANRIDWGTPGGLDLTPVNDPTQVAGFYNNAAQFDEPTQQHLEVAADIFGGLYKFTLNCWFRMVAQTGTEQYLIAQARTASNESVSLFLLDDGRVRVFINNGTGRTLTSTTTFNTGWHNASVFFDSIAGLYSLYVDGGLEDSGNSGTNPISVGLSMFTLGVRPRGTLTRWNNGIIDEVCMYNDVPADPATFALALATGPAYPRFKYSIGEFRVYNAGGGYIDSGKDFWSPAFDTWLKEVDPGGTFVEARFDYAIEPSHIPVYSSWMPWTVFADAAKNHGNRYTWLELRISNIDTFCKINYLQVDGYKTDLIPPTDVTGIASIIFTDLGYDLITTFDGGQEVGIAEYAGANLEIEVGGSSYFQYANGSFNLVEDYSQLLLKGAELAHEIIYTLEYPVKPDRFRINAWDTAENVNRGEWGVFIEPVTIATPTLIVTGTVATITGSEVGYKNVVQYTKKDVDQWGTLGIRIGDGDVNFGNYPLPNGTYTGRVMSIGSPGTVSDSVDFIINNIISPSYPDINWDRWVFASICQHFDNRRGTIPMYVEGTHRDTETIKDFFELRVDGPWITEESKNCWKLYTEINILCQSAKDFKDFHRLRKMTGIVSQACTDYIEVFKFGKDVWDDQSLVGCLKRMDTGYGKSQERIQITHFGQIEPRVELEQASVEAHYEMILFV